MADITASMGLKVTADTTEVVKSFTQAEQAGAKMGDTVEKRVGEGLKKAAVEAKKLAAETKATQSTLDKWAEAYMKAGKASAAFNQTVEVFGKVGRFAQGALDMAKFSTEMARLERAVPVAKMRQLQEETRGTVSRFDLLQRAAKELGLSATAGLTDAGLALGQSLAAWENFFDRAKAAIGSFLGAVIVGIDRLSDAIAGVDSRLQTGATRRQNSTANAERSTDIARLRRAAASDPRLAGMADRYEQGGYDNISIRAKEAIGRGSASWNADYRTQLVLVENRKQADIHDRITRDAQAANSRGLGGIGLPDWGSAISGEKAGLGIFGSKSKGGGGGAGATGKPRSAFDTIYQAQLDGFGRAVNGDSFASRVDGSVGNLETNFGNLGGFGTANKSFADRAKAAFGGVGGAANENLKKQQADVARMTEMVKGTFDVFGSALGAALAAAVSGGENAIAIGKRVLKAKLQNIAAESLVMAAYQGAMALGSLAIGDGRGAATHGLSAAKFAVTAALAGAGSAAVGGGGSSSQGSASSAPGGGFAMSGGPMSGGVREQTINVNMFGSMTAGNWRDLSRQIRRGLAEGEAAGLGSAGNDNITGRVE